MAYEQIVYWRRNLFLVPSGSAGKKFVSETARLINAFVDSSAMKTISLKALMIMPALLLQKPSAKSKAKDHTAALKRRLDLWEKGDFEELIREGETIQRHLKSKQTAKSIEDISKEFINKMSKGNINGAIKLLTNNMQNGVLPLTDETLNLLFQKHPEPQEAHVDALLPGIHELIHSVRYEDITPDLIRRSAMRTNGGAGPSGLDGDGWRRIITSNSFGTASTDLCTSIANLAKMVCTEIHSPTSLEPLMASRLIPLDKNPGLRPIGIGEVLRRIIGKSIVSILKEDIKQSIGSLQVCAGQDAGCEAAVHAMRTLFEEDESEAVLLIDAANAFNAVNRNVFLHNVKIICPPLSTFVQNCYQSPARLFVFGGKELKSTEGTTQGDPIAMFVYAIATIPLIVRYVLREEPSDEKARTAGYADDLFGAGTIWELKQLWLYIRDEGPKFGYYQQEEKTWLIVKPEFLSEAMEIFSDTQVKITTDGRKHLGAAVGSLEYRDEFINEKIDDWVSELSTLAKIAKFAPQEAYTCFTAGYKHKFNYCMRTIPDVSAYFNRIDNVISTELIPAITGGIVPSEIERKLFSLPPSKGGLGIPIFSEQANFEFANSCLVTEALQNDITNQNTAASDENEAQIKTAKSIIRERKKSRINELLNTIKSSDEMSKAKLRLLNLNSECGASLWLTTLPIKDEGYQLDKQSFWDLLKIRYGYQLSRLPERCPCGSPFNIQHALSCKKGGFVTQRHNTLRDVTAKLMTEVCNDVKVEPPLSELTGERFRETTANVTPEARLDVSARNFWVTHQRAFFDIRVFNPTARRYADLEIKKCYEINEREKKRQYNERVLRVEHGSFSPMVFSAFGGMARECSMVIKRLVELLADKRKTNVSLVSSWVKRKINLSLMKSLVYCVRGTRHPWYRDNYIVSSCSNDTDASEVSSAFN
ncbi:uncharacterized protein [Clytia hemisphaerica]|uniref:uncharacterized protein n=1 Tax=Clytia hemisphaerica TaxID=252671 RepID=UPI0034D3BA61